VLDGELLIQGRGALPSKDEYKQTCSIVRRNGKKTGLVYHVFDVLPLNDYAARRSTIPYRTRRVALERIKAAAPFVEVVPVLYSGTDTAQIEKQIQQQREAHHEGIMINLNDAPYSFTRTAAMLKYKIMSDCDLRIVALNPGTGRNAETLGSLSVDYKGNTLRVGAGIPNALRRAIWDNPAAYIGRVVTVQYFEETQDKAGKKSLRFPVFKELREIGKSVSYA
jgi:DNA ligase-1